MRTDLCLYVVVCVCVCVCVCDTQVSELSHRLGSAEGANRSLEDEVSRLRAMCGALSSDKSDREVTINDIRAKLLAAEEKVRGCACLPACALCLSVLCTPRYVLPACVFICVCVCVHCRLRPSRR